MALTLRGFSLLAMVAALLSGGAIAGISVVAGKQVSEAALFSLGGVPLGLIVAGCWYLVDVARDLSGLKLHAEELEVGEVVELATPHSIVHYKSGNPRRAWEAVGGKLFLTNRRLAFLAHRGQPYSYRLFVPRADIVHADDSAPITGLGGGLLVTRADGTKELFGFGAVRALDTEPWVAAILSRNDVQ